MIYSPIILKNFYGFVLWKQLTFSFWLAKLTGLVVLISNLKKIFKNKTKNKLWKSWRIFRRR